MNFIDLAREKCLDPVTPNLRCLKLVRVEELENFSIASASVLKVVVLD